MIDKPDSQRLARVIRASANPAIAVSGGVDSMTLALFCSSVDLSFEVFHALSPAVPPAATQRVRNEARCSAWRLREIDSGEFADQRYLKNPLNRCYFCKSNLYAEIRCHTNATIFSGTNLDDLSDFRPGLQAATNNNVIHPFVEAGFNKQAVRRLARQLGADHLAELPASPCLASRIETGIAIEAPVLNVVDGVENWLSRDLGIRGPRCRVRSDRIAIEVPPDSVPDLDSAIRGTIVERVMRDFADLRADLPVTIETYRMGSAFVASREVR